MSFSFEHEPTPLENELNQEAEFEAIQSGLQASISEEEHEQIRHDIEGPHVLIASPEKQTKVERIINEIKAFCGDEESIVIKEIPAMGIHETLEIAILCNDISMDKSGIESFFNALKMTDGMMISQGVEEDTIRISVSFKNFYTKIG